ncbi:hypothetical protein ACMD2_03956 [Ananas comosus]|uniref:Uncharacterized protein n=1 Tax=Ananas comosus TaxID=4615 RepID=A0A199V5P7_ANACO|nr:hypothetical protein ACMD2_03956 [Ananas comosus]
MNPERTDPMAPNMLQKLEKVTPWCWILPVIICIRNHLYSAVRSSTVLIAQKENGSSVMIGIYELMGHQTSFRKKFFMGPSLDDLALLDHSNHVNISNGGKTVSNNNSCSAHHKAVQSFLDYALGTSIQRTGGFIKEKYLGVL